MAATSTAIKEAFDALIRAQNEINLHAPTYQAAPCEVCAQLYMVWNSARDKYNALIKERIG